VGIRCRSGFTLVETVVVTAIIAVLATVGLAAYPPLLESMQLRSGSTALAGMIREAQQRAVAEGRLWRVVISTDRRSYRLQYAVSPLASADCASTGWADYGEPSALPRFISLTEESRTCLAFSASGRAEWPNPVIAQWLGMLTIPPLVDGEEVPNADMMAWPTWGQAVADARVAGFRRPNTPQFTVDLGETRPFSSVCLGMFSWPVGAGGFKFPATMLVEAASVPENGGPPSSGWTTLHSGPTGLTNPGNNVRTRECKTIDINGEYRFFRFTFSYAAGSNYVIVDEFNVTDMQFKLAGTKKARLLTVKPVTGRVIVQSVNP